jgi:alginate O-acetyltransferase complex protein AlgJ
MLDEGKRLSSKEPLAFVQGHEVMVMRCRRYFAIAAFVLLATPLLVGIVHPDSPETVLKEGRNLAPTPKIPVDRDDWLTLPKEIDAYLQDHFGLRQVLVQAYMDLTEPLDNGNNSVLVGREGRLFYLGDDAVRQSAGLIVRDRRVAHTVAFLERVNAALAARGVRFIVAIPPNGATIYQDFLPIWARNPGRRTEYDLLLDELAANGIRAVDLRPPIKAARAQGPAFYMHDTHWTDRGALAGFNAVVEANSHPDWRIDPRSALGPLTPRKGGDLARMLGFEDSASETAENWTLPPERRDQLAATDHDYASTPYDYVALSGHPGPTIMVLGDSFTADFFARMLLPHVERELSLHHNWCGFDWRAIDHFHPDEVWWMPTERYLVCNVGAAPANFAQ